MDEKSRRELDKLAEELNQWIQSGSVETATSKTYFTIVEAYQLGERDGRKIKGRV